jgi:hypothetical protein
MISQDKFGNPIYPRIYKKLRENEKILIGLGFKEAKKKPNLFFLKDEDGILFFADMRGTTEVPIWEDTRPLFYYKFDAVNWPDWKKRRRLNEFMSILEENGCECRLSFEEDLANDITGGNGYCSFCGKDFQDEGLFCSEECEKAQEETYRDNCAKCGKSLDWKSVVQHHVSYSPEKTIPLCRSCHIKIHRDSAESALKPKKGSAKKYYSGELKEKRKCQACGEEMHHATKGDKCVPCRESEEYKAGRKRTLSREERAKLKRKWELNQIYGRGF